MPGEAGDPAFPAAKPRWFGNRGLRHRRRIPQLLAQFIGAAGDCIARFALESGLQGA